MPTCPKPAALPSGSSPTPRRCGSSSGGPNRPPARNWPCLPSTATTPSSPTETESPWNWRPIQRSHAEIKNAIRDLKYGVGLNHLRSTRSLTPHLPSALALGRPLQWRPGPIALSAAPFLTDRWSPTLTRQPNGYPPDWRQLRLTVPLACLPPRRFPLTPPLTPPALSP